MSLRGTSVLAGVFGLALALPAPAQFGPGMGGQPGNVPVFQGNPLRGQQALNQAWFNQGFAGPGVAGLPNYGRLINTPGVVSGTGFFPSLGYSSPTDPSFSAPPSQPYFPPFYSPYYQYFDPAGNYLRGIGDLTLAYGRYAQDYQRARLLNQEVERSMIDTRRRLYEEWRYYESMRPMAEDVRRDTLARDLARARKQPPISEILSAKSLNDLLGYLKGESAKEKRGPALLIDEELLRQINVSPEGPARNIGLIKSGKVNWPLVLKEQAFNDSREKLDDTLRDALQQARNNGKVDAALQVALNKSAKELDTTLDKIAPTLSMQQYMEAKRYLNWLSEGLRALEGENVAQFFAENGTYRARGKTVGDLVAYMTRNGLRFAGAVPGDEAAYRALYNLLAAYDEAIQLVSR